MSIVENFQSRWQTMSPGGLYFLKSFILQKKKKLFKDVTAALEYFASGKRNVAMQRSWVGMGPRPHPHSSVSCLPATPHPSPSNLVSQPYLPTAARIVCLLRAYLLSAICYKTDFSDHHSESKLQMRRLNVSYDTLYRVFSPLFVGTIR